MSKILLIGLGGIGCQIVRSTLHNFHRRLGPDQPVDGIGIDYEHQGDLYVFQNFAIEDAGSQVNLLWNRDPYFKTYWPSNSDGPFADTGKIGRGAAAGQLRPNGRLAAISHYSTLDGTLRSFFLEQGVIKSPTGQQRGDFKVFIISSLGGGTGSGIMHDVVFACRSMINRNDFLIGLFVDGAVVKAWAEEKTGTMGYAALVELEHWMTNPDDYYVVPLEKAHEKLWEDRRAQYANGPALNYLDLCLLVSRLNKNDNSLFGLKTGSIPGDYVELAAGWLYAFLAGDVLTNHKNKSKVFENVLNRLRGKKAAIKIGDGRSQQYGSIGCSMLSIPIRKISQYLGSSMIIDIVDGAMSRNASLDKDPSQYLQERQLDQAAGNSARDTLRGKSIYYKKIITRYDGARLKLQQSRNYSNLMDVVRTNKLSVAETEWLNPLNSYINELKGLIQNLYDEEIKHLDNWVAQKLHDHFPIHIGTWLSDMGARLDKCVAKLNQTNLLQSGDWVELMKSQCNAVGKFSAMAQFFKWDEGRDRLTKPLSLFFNALQKQEATTLIEYLYNPLKAAVQLRIDCLKELHGQVKALQDSQRTIKQQFIVRDWFIDEEKMKGSYHPLELEIGTHHSFVSHTESTIRTHLKGDEILSQLTKPTELLRAQSVWETFASYYRRLLNERIKERVDPNKKSEAEAVIDNMATALGAFVQDKVVYEIEEIISQRVTLKEALDSFLEEKYAIAKAYNPRSASAREVRQLFSNHFGSQGSDDLLSVGNRDVRNWSDKAVAYLVNKLSQFSAPFWKQNDTLRLDLDTHHHPGWSRSQQFIYAQDPQIRTVLQKERTLIGNDFQVAPIEDKHTLAIVQLVFGYPLYTVTSWAEDRLLYLDHCQKWVQGSANEPYHVDQRFYVEWKDDLSQAQRQEEKTENLIILTYLLAIGKGVMTGGAKRKNKYVFQGKSLAPTLPKLVEKLHKDAKILSKLSGATYASLLTDLAQAASGDRASMEQLWHHFLKGYQDLTEIQPPKTTGNRKPFEIWDRYVNASQIEWNNGKWELHGRLIPKTQHDFRELEQKLRPGK